MSVFCDFFLMVNITAAKWKYRFLMKMNDLIIHFFFCIFVIHFTKGTFFTDYLDAWG